MKRLLLIFALILTAGVAGAQEPTYWRPGIAVNAVRQESIEIQIAALQRRLDRVKRRYPEMRTSAPNTPAIAPEMRTSAFSDQQTTQYHSHAADADYPETTPVVKVRSISSPNFVVNSGNAAFDREVASAAEKWRKALAKQWLGRELPDWPEPCPIRVRYGNNIGAGGVTSFSFSNGGVGGWSMKIQGSRQRVLDSVLPHEVLHTVFATYFRQPLPRWCDEGACSTVESSVERDKHDEALLVYLKTQRGIPFNKMFSMRQYPADIFPLYAQGHSLATFLLHHGGTRHFVACISDGLNDSWVSAIKSHYGYENLGDLQNSWLAWVKAGSPAPDKMRTSAQPPWLTYRQEVGWCPPGGMRAPAKPRSRPPLYTGPEDDEEQTPEMRTSAPEPTPATQTCDTDAILKAIKQIQDQVDAISKQAAVPGPQGEPGPAGKDGAQGPKGDPGPAAELGNLQAQVNLLQTAINDLQKPLEVQILDPSGKVVEHTSVRLGKEPLRFQLIPVKGNSTTPTK